MKPFDDLGREIDATFSVADHPTGFDLIFESRSGAAKGSDRTRNSEYAFGLEILLSRLAKASAVMQAVMLDSDIARALPEEERILNVEDFEMPLALTAHTDINKLRLAIGRQSSAFGRSADLGGGNRTKRLRLRFAALPAFHSRPDIERTLSGLKKTGDGTVTLPSQSAQQAEFEVAVQAALARLTAQTKGLRSAGSSAPPVGKVYPTFHFDRDPEVVAIVLTLSEGRCEVCDRPAPFTRENGLPFLEVHHVKRLAHGGPDSTNNAIACCPNCHRQLHHGADREELRRYLLAKVGRLVQY